MQQALLQFWRGQVERIKDRLRPGIPRNRREAKAPQSRLDASFWSDENRELLAVLIPALSDASQDGAEWMVNWVDSTLGIGIDWTLINADAVEWARKYAAELVRGINSTTRDQIKRHVSAWLDTPGRTMGDLFAELESLPGFNESRAQMIAVTEITRAYAEGNKLSAQKYEDEGLFTWKRVWQTNNDDKVCPLCAPLHGTTAKGTDGEYEDGTQHPPRHPRCRCWENWEPDISRVAFTVARGATDAEIEATGNLFVFNEGSDWTPDEREIADRALEKLSALNPFRDITELVRVTGQEEFVAYSLGDGRVMVGDAFFDEFYQRILNKSYGGRPGVLAHELGHELAEQMIPEQRAAYADIFARNKNWWRDNYDKVGIKTDYSNIDEVTLRYWPSYQAMNGWQEDLAESYRVYLRAGGEMGDLGERRELIQELLR